MESYQIIDFHAHIVAPATLREQHPGETWWPRVYRDTEGRQQIEHGGNSLGAIAREMSDPAGIVAAQAAAGVEVVVLSASERAAMLGGNAARLLKL